ncbi:MAG: PAAR domain-containing protein [Polyangiaceae bacterium]|nr:PAAR domain-containing protein [Polyangiaceae bacterium]
MGKPLIVVGDKTSHGGVVLKGGTLTDADGKPIARVGDPVACPMPGHGTNPIVTGDPVVQIDGAPVARHGDSTACGATLISGQMDVLIESGSSAGQGEQSAAMTPQRDPEASDKTIVPYELILVNEREQPLANVRVLLETPSGEEVCVTGADGAARTRGVAGTAIARVLDPASLRQALSGSEKLPRYTRAKLDENVQIRALTNATKPVKIPSGKPQTLMIATRFDFYDVGHAPSWGDLALANRGSWSFADSEDDSGLSLFQAHADGSGAAVKIACKSEPSTTWVEAKIDAIHQAMERADFKFLNNFLEKLPIDRKPDSTTAEGKELEET